MQNFDVYFLGETLAGTDPATVRSGVAQLFKAPPEKVERLFSGNSVRVKQGVDAETASRYRAAFREVGALVQIVPEGEPAPGPSMVTNSGTGQPATTGATGGSSEGGMGLAEPGAIIDDTPPPPPASIDTGTLEALPANSGTLEDCRIEKEPLPLPDISHLSLTDD